MKPPTFGTGYTFNTNADPAHSPLLYLTEPWIYLVMLFIVGIVILNFTMCLCISCERRTPMPVLKGKELYEDDDEEELTEMNINEEKLK